MNFPHMLIILKAEYHVSLKPVNLIVKKISHYCFHFYFLLYYCGWTFSVLVTPWGIWDLSSWRGSNTCLLQWKHRVSTTGSPVKSLWLSLLKQSSLLLFSPVSLGFFFFLLNCLFSYLQILFIFIHICCKYSS